MRRFKPFFAAVLLAICGIAHAQATPDPYTLARKWLGAAPPTVQVLPQYKALSDAIGAQAPLLIHPSPALSNRQWLDLATYVPWQHQPAATPTPAPLDFTDANGIDNGPTPAITASGKSATLDISAYANELKITGAVVTNVVIDGVDVTAQAWWVGNGGAGNKLPNAAGYPVVVPNAGGKSMTVTTNTVGPWRADPLKLPAVVDYPYVGPRNEPDLLNIEATSWAAIAAPAGFHAAGASGTSTATKPAGMGSAIPPGYTFESDGKVSYLRVHPFTGSPSGTGGGRIINFYYPFTPFGLKEIYCGDLTWFEPGVWDMTQDGVKLSGVHFTSPWVQPAQMTGAMIQPGSIFEQSNVYYGKKNALDRDVFGVHDYMRDVKTGGANPSRGPSFALLQTGRWYWMEFHLKQASAPGLADGLVEYFVNGNLMRAENHDWGQIAGIPQVIYEFQVQIYNGGLGNWLNNDGYYRKAKFECASHYIGVPNEVR